MEDRRKGFLEAIENDTEYDYIANNYYKLSKDELKDICLELIFAVHRAENGGIESYEIMDEVTEELKERWS